MKHDEPWILSPSHFHLKICKWMTGLTLKLDRANTRNRGDPSKVKEKWKVTKTNKKIVFFKQCLLSQTLLQEINLFICCMLYVVWKTFC